MFENLDIFLQGRASLNVEKTGLPTEKDLQIATTAILVQMAESDGNLAQQEITSLVNVLKREFKVSEEDAGHLINLADFMRKDKGKLDEFVALINERFEKSQKLTVFSMLWKIMQADGLISTTEATLAAELAGALKLSEEDVIRARDMANIKK